MTGVLSGDLRAYFDEARRWDEDRLAQSRLTLRLALAVGGAFATLAIFETVALSALVPLKSVEPFVVRVNQATGAVDVITALKADRPLTYDEAVSKYFIAAYVRAREGYLPGSAAFTFRQVALFSAPDEQARWSEAYRGSNPKSPQVVYGQAGVAEVSIRAISLLSPKVASVRFHRTIRLGAETKDADFVATIAFNYVKAPMLEADRLLNPLGFQVSSYRSDPEVPNGA